VVTDIQWRPVLTGTTGMRRTLAHRMDITVMHGSTTASSSAPDRGMDMATMAEALAGAAMVTVADIAAAMDIVVAMAVDTVVAMAVDTVVATAADTVAGMPVAIVVAMLAEGIAAAVALADTRPAAASMAVVAAASTAVAAASMAVVVVSMAVAAATVVVIAKLQMLHKRLPSTGSRSCVRAGLR
jgi:hypothetical protein